MATQRFIIRSPEGRTYSVTHADFLAVYQGLGYVEEGPEAVPGAAPSPVLTTTVAADGTIAQAVDGQTVATTTVGATGTIRTAFAASGRTRVTTVGPDGTITETWEVST